MVGSRWVSSSMAFELKGEAPFFPRSNSSASSDSLRLIASSPSCSVGSHTAGEAFVRIAVVGRLAGGDVGAEWYFELGFGEGKLLVLCWE